MHRLLQGLFVDTDRPGDSQVEVIHVVPDKEEEEGEEEEEEEKPRFPKSKEESSTGRLGSVAHGLCRSEGICAGERAEEANAGAEAEATAEEAEVGSG